MSYKERLKNALSGVDLDSQVDLSAKEAHLQLQTDKLATQRSINEATKAYEATLSASPYNTENIIAAHRKLTGLKAGLEFLEMLEKEEFSDK